MAMIILVIISLLSASILKVAILSAFALHDTSYPVWRQLLLVGKSISYEQGDNDSCKPRRLLDNRALAVLGWLFPSGMK